ncbi:hypothetical protein [Petropleomorpha daqingensis]|uniref:ABC-type oligopeptide transport system substrate-binding subunit n=1 Tax=Petropleomorpha daqingensis TaxID=2026353 RepID=A0A853CCJ9_9ACTN|nr:hypothetical protein [Petropleomorpha daqingensis]NYJ05745.1 ABC-type oligopeptide transport system substrate-binding subunit [Petropleomorpha daqingensis]
MRRFWILALLAAAALLLAACGPGGRYVSGSAVAPEVVVSAA